MADTRVSAEALLDEIEWQLGLVDSYLLNAEPGELQDACAELRNSAVAFSRLLESAFLVASLEQSVRRRIDAVAERLDMQRQGLFRRSGVVDRALGSIVRPGSPLTYAIPGEPGAFGAGGRIVSSH